MKISLKKVKIAMGLSEETFAYSAELYIDGQLTAHASNHGQGGCDLYRPVDRDAQARLDAAETHYRSQTVEFQGMPLSNSLELVVGELLNDHVAKQDMLRAFRTKIIFRKQGEGGLYAVPSRAKDRPQRIEAIRKRHPGAVVLNALPVDQALEIWKAAA
jgi:hypothetical protein